MSSPDAHDVDPADPSPDAGHLPVMLEEVLAQLEPRPGETVFDATVGRAGHARAVAPRLAPDGRYVAVDLDPANVAFARDQLADLAPVVRTDVLHRGFDAIESVLMELDVAGLDGVLADLGFASAQMDDPRRGLSFQASGPLDMRLDPTAETTAADLVQRLPERELADLIYKYGDERFSRRIARKIVEQRERSPIKTTEQLAELCAAAYGPRGRRQRIHPATRTFMALRIAVNDELGRLDALLDQLPGLLRPDARVVIISFHSLEDRAVKQRFRQWAAADRAALLTRKPLRPTEAERHRNPRSRSAKLRALRWRDAGNVGNS